MWIFGKLKHQEVHIAEKRKTVGYIEMEKARVRWFLSLERNDLPEKAVEEGKPTYRSIKVEGEEVEFSGGFIDLHTFIYERTLEGNGFGLDDVRPVINLLYEIRNMKANSMNKISRHNLLLHPLILKINNEI